MTDQAAADAEGADGAGEDNAEETEGQPKPSGKMPGKKLVLFIAAPLLLLIAGGAGVYFSGLADSLLGKSETTAAEEELLAKEEAGPVAYFEVPDMLVNLNTNGRKTGYLKIALSLVLGSEEDRAQVEQVLPRVIDSFQVYLRELRVEDLQGSAGLQRLREELLLRVATAAKPAEVKDVLFREMLIQ